MPPSQKQGPSMWICWRDTALDLKSLGQSWPGTEMWPSCSSFICAMMQFLGAWHGSRKWPMIFQSTHNAWFVVHSICMSLLFQVWGRPSAKDGISNPLWANGMLEVDCIQQISCTSASWYVMIVSLKVAQILTACRTLISWRCLTLSALLVDWWSLSLRSAYWLTSAETSETFCQKILWFFFACWFGRV